jgi:hypothetical protein
MVAIEMYTLKEVGDDYAVLSGERQDVRIDFADEDPFTKEDSEAFFSDLLGKPVAIEREAVRADCTGRINVFVDFWNTDQGMKAVPFPFSVSGVRVQSATINLRF